LSVIIVVIGRVRNTPISFILTSSYINFSHEHTLKVVSQWSILVHNRFSHGCLSCLHSSFERKAIDYRSGLNEENLTRRRKFRSFCGEAIGEKNTRGGRLLMLLLWIKWFGRLFTSGPTEADGVGARTDLRANQQQATVRVFSVA
jgi:hypothetical protein